MLDHETGEGLMEAVLDRAVLRRLATDPAYLNAASASEQAEREEQIEREEWDRMMEGDDHA